MKNIINKIIFFAAILFAAGISQNAAAVGYYIDDGAADIYTASGYPDANRAENAAVQFCVDNSTNSEEDCRAFDTQASFENSAIAYESNYSVLTGATANDAYNALLDTCVDFGDAADRNACSQAHLRRDLVKICGDGTAEDLTDGCDVRFMPPTTTPPPQNGPSFGYYIDDISEIFTASGFPDAGEAEKAAVQFCVDNSTNSRMECEEITARGSFSNEAIAHNPNYDLGRGNDADAAHGALLDRCASLGNGLNREQCSQGILRRDAVEICGDGTAADETDDCDVRYIPLTCGTGTTGNGGIVNGNCVCMDSTHNLITDTTTNTQTCEIPDGVPIPNRCPTSGQYDVNVGVNFPGNQACTAITQPAGATNDGENIPGITVVFAGVFNGNRTFAVINNRTDGGGDIDYRNGFGANAILVPIDSRLPTIRLSDISATNGEPTPVGHQNDIEIGTGALSFANHQYYSRPQTVGIAFCTGGQTNDPDDMTMCVTLPTCGTGATLNGNVCECTTDALPILLDDGLSCRARMNEDCTGATPDLFNGVCVAACQPDEARNSAGNCVPNPANCGANAITNPDDNTNCVCIDDMHRFVAGSTTACEPIPTNPNTPTCEEHQMLNSSDECVNRTAENCGNMQVFEPASGGGGVCTSAAMFLSSVSFISPTYTAESCENARWAVSIAINNEKTAAAEVCGIPVVRDDTADDSETAAAANAETAAAAESVPLQFPENENANGCIIRESADFLTLPDCNDSQLFGNIGFPQMPENFAVATDRLTVAFVADGENQIFFNGENITDSASQPPQPPIINSQTQTAEQDNEALEQFGYIGAGAIAVVAIATFIEGGGFPSFDFSPDFGYRITESGYAANIGGRADFRKDNWHLYYFANQTNNNGEFGDFRYTSGGKYTGDFWAAAFSESVAGETAKYDFSLSADVDGSLIALSPVYRLHSFYDKGKTETRNELNLQGEFRYNGWTIRPAAGFRWENENDFSDNGRFQMNAVYRF